MVTDPLNIPSTSPLKNARNSKKLRESRAKWNQYLLCYTHSHPLFQKIVQFLNMAYGVNCFLVQPPLKYHRNETQNSKHPCPYLGIRRSFWNGGSIFVINDCSQYFENRNVEAQFFNVKKGVNFPTIWTNNHSFSRVRLDNS